jgi:hypothetical protein
VTLTNIGAQPLSISTIAVTGMNASDFIPAHTCGSSLAAGASCIISAVFKPTQIRPRTAAISITDSAGDSPQTVALSGTGVFSGPNATLSGTSLTFATQLVGGTTPAQSITLINYGAATLSIASIGIKGVNPSDFAQTNTCGSLVAPTGSCTISVTFKPTQRGSRAASLSLMDNAPGSLQTVSLSGTATVVEFNPASLSFGVVQPGQSKNLSTTLTNTGPGTLSIAGITLIGTDADEFSQVHTCGSIVGAGQSCTISVTFTPKEGGTDNAALSISDNGGGSPQQVSLSGSGKVVQQYVCNCGGPCNYFCTLIRRCGCHYTPSSGALLELEEERSSRVSCNANWSDRLPEFRERY